MTKLPKGFGIPKMGVGVHQADLSTEIRRSFGTLEDPHGASPVDHRSIEQPSAIRPLQMKVNEIKVIFCLLRRQHVVNHCMNHREQAVTKTGLVIQGVQKVSHRFRIFKVHIAWNDTIHQQVLSKIGQNVFGLRLQETAQDGLTDPAKSRSQTHEHLIVQGDRP